MNHEIARFGPHFRDNFRLVRRRFLKLHRGRRRDARRLFRPATARMAIVAVHPPSYMNEQQAESFHARRPFQLQL